MLARTWIALFRHIPPDHHPRFSLVTVNGTEISIQLILRLEADFAIIKGRLSGSQEAGRVFFIPYSSIDTFSFTSPVRETDVNDLFGTLTFDEPVAEPEPAAAPEPPPVAPSAQAAENGKAVEPGSGPRPVIRSEVLERFRSSRPSSSVNLPRPVEGR
jgi:hypothetical protein